MKQALHALLLAAVLLAVSVAAAPADGQHVSHPQWGFSFQTPQHWVCESDASGAILQSPHHSGIILVMPNSISGAGELKARMQEGLVEDGTHLIPTGPIRLLREGILAGDYSGSFDYQEARALIIGTYSKQGGGAWVMALDAPTSFHQALADAASNIADGMQYAGSAAAPPGAAPQAQAGSPNLMHYFDGTYYSFTGGAVTSGGTERRLTICENGRFFFSSESGYSGGAGASGAWGAASQSGSGGTWSISGTKEAGVISLTYSNGSREDVRYQVCGKGCIYFNNIMYGYEKAAVCD